MTKKIVKSNTGQEALRLQAMIAFFLASFLLCSCHLLASGSEAEYELQSAFLKDHDPSSVPSKNTSKPLMVTFDMALRSIQNLNERAEKLTISVWIRMKWKNEFFTWNPQNHSGVKSININKQQVWKPDVTLYNSANSGGILFDQMETNMIVEHDGTTSWFCPLIFESQCPVDLIEFPFDRQSCSLTFGLWQVPYSDGPRVSLTLLNPFADLKNYQKSSIYELNGVPAKETVSHFACCPDKQYTILTYDINMTRRTLFYLIDFFLPTAVLVVLLLTSYIVPPESGERMTLMISLLLALVLHLLHISNHIPRTSDSVPVITKLLNASIVLSAVTMLASAVAVKWSLFSNKGERVPWVIRVLFNKYLSRAVFAKRPITKAENINNTQAITFGEGTFVDENAASLRKRSVDDLSENCNRIVRERSLQNTAQVPGSFHERNARIIHQARMKADFSNAICQDLRVITQHMDEIESEKAYQSEWRFAICVLDRLLCCFSFISVLATCVYFLFFSTSVYFK